jgi:hypothetical protein
MVAAEPAVGDSCERATHTPTRRADGSRGHGTDNTQNDLFWAHCPPAPNRIVVHASGNGTRREVLAAVADQVTAGHPAVCTLGTQVDTLPGERMRREDS